MASVPPIKPQPQFGVGEFGAANVFDGLLGLRYAWGTTFGKTLPDIDAELARINKGAGTPFVVPKAGQINLFGTAGLKMLENIGQGLTHTQAAAVNLYITEAWAYEGIGAGIERLAEDVLQTHKVAKQRSLPGKIIPYIRPVQRADLRPALKRAATAEKAARKAEAHAARLEKRVALLEREAKQARTAAVPLPWPPGGIGVGVGGRVGGRVGKLGKYVGLAAFLALLAKALEKIGGQFIRCSNTKRWGKNICGMHPGLLETLLVDTLLVVATIDLVTFARANQSLVSVAAHPIRAFWQADKF